MTHSLTRAERHLEFPDLPGAEDVEPQSIDELFTAQIKQAVRAGELLSSLSTEAVALLLKTIFYGVPLATMHLLWESQRQLGSRFPLSMGSWEAVVQSCSTPCITHRWTSHDRGELPRENGGKCERSQCITERAEEWVLPLTDPAE